MRILTADLSHIKILFESSTIFYGYCASLGSLAIRGLSRPKTKRWRPAGIGSTDQNALRRVPRNKRTTNRAWRAWVSFKLPCAEKAVLLERKRPGENKRGQWWEERGYINTRQPKRIQGEHVIVIEDPGSRTLLRCTHLSKLFLLLSQYIVTRMYPTLPSYWLSHISCSRFEDKKICDVSQMGSVDCPGSF